MGINLYDNQYSEMIERARLDLGNNLRLAQGLLTALQSSLSRQNLTQAQINTKTQQTRKIIDEMKARRQKVFDTAKTWYEAVGKCYWKVDQKDADIDSQEIETEKAYLRQVHRDILKLRQSAGADEQAKIQARVHFTRFAERLQRPRSNFKGRLPLYRGSISRSASQNISCDGLTTGRGRDQTKLGPGSNSISAKSLDLDVPIVANSQSLFLPFLDSEDQFVAFRESKWRLTVSPSPIRT